MAKHSRAPSGRREILSLVSFGILAQALTVLSGPLSARVLGAEGRGEVVTVTTVALLASTLFVGGYPTALTHAVAEARAPARDVMLGRLFPLLIWCSVPAVAAGCLCLILLYRSDNVLALTLGAGIAALLSGWTLIIAAMLQGERTVAAYNRSRIIGIGSYVVLVLAIFVVYDRTGPLIFVAALILSQIIGLASAWFGLQAKAAEPVSQPPFSAMHRMARRSWVSGVSAIDGLGLTQLLVAVALGQSALGIYSVATTAANIPGVVMQSVSSMLLARMAAAPSNLAQHVMQRWVLAAMSLNVVMFVALEAFIDPVIRIAFGQDFVSAIFPARILILAWTLLAARRILTAVCQAQSRARPASLIEIVAAVALVVSAFPLMSAFGLDGAAYSMLVAGSVSCAALAITVRWSRSWVRPDPVMVDFDDVARLGEGDGAVR